MTRLRFLLVTFGGAVALVLGFNRERMARAWLRRNGFIITECERNFLGAPELRRYTVLINHSKLGVVGARRRDSRAPTLNPASQYLDWLAKNGFTITEYREEHRFVRKDSEDFIWATTELAPPTIHRFDRPWWV